MSGGTNQGNGSLSRAERERRGLEHTWIAALGGGELGFQES